MIDRRRFLALSLAGAACSVSFDAREALALGRTPIGGRVSLRVPWSIGSIDPHDLHDPAAALFAAAISDAAYALDAAGAPYPALAAAMPSREGEDTVVRLRPGLRTARGAALDGHDLIASIERARSRGGAAVLAQIPRPAPHRSERLAVTFGEVDPGHLAHALASPIVAVLPRGFDPAAPDGTGAFRADIAATRLTLTRNLLAARGASFLDAIDVAPAEDLKASLRAFEAEYDDVGWLGLGLHDGRKNALRFDVGRAAWIVLATGTDAGAFGLPGVAQRLADAIPRERLVPVGLGNDAGSLGGASSGGDPGWGGPPTELLVDAASPHLVEIGRTIAPILSRPGHEVTLAPIARAEIARRRVKGKATLRLEIARPVGPGPLLTLLALATAEDPARGRDLARARPLVSPSSLPRSLTSALRVGVLGALEVGGGVVPDLALPRAASGDGWDLGAAYRRAARRV